MRIWRGLETITEPFKACALAVGVFDGIHVGHQELIRRAVANGQANSRPAAVLTFDRHPLELIAPEQAPGYLTTDSQRARIFQELGVQDLVIARFDERLRDLSPEGFLRFVVCGVLGARSVFVGADFRFGRNQTGDTSYLKSAAARCDLEVTVLDPILVDGQRASSSRARDLLRFGEVEQASCVLGRPYALVGRVVEGQKLGRKLGFPTANIRTEVPMVIPGDGIYAVWVDHRSEQVMGACSIGMRPAVGGTERTVEAYLLDFEGDLYGTELEIEFIQRIRDESDFDSLEALVEQIGRDVERTREILSEKDR